jgi:simple sugar transport system permease protein
VTPGGKSLKLARRLKGATKYAILDAVSPIVAVLFAMAVASIALVIIGKNPFQVYATMVSFSFGRADSVASIFFKATPLIFSGLAVAVGFRVGLFNIGVEGQYLMGAFLASWAGFAIKGLPGYVHLPLVILAGALGGALWAFVPIWLKVKRGVHEVITTIMLNHTAFLLLHYLIFDVFMDKSQVVVGGAGSPRVRMPPIELSARVPNLHDALAVFGINLPAHAAVNWLLIGGIALAVGVWYLLWRTPFGLELRTVGHNPRAAETAGIRPQVVYFKAFLLSGAVAGLVGLSDLLGYFGYLDIDFPRGYGFAGIAVALVGRNSPFGIILAALLFGFLSRGGLGIQVLERVPMETYVILQGLIILSIVVASEVVRRYVRAQQKKEEAAAHAEP